MASNSGAAYVNGKITSGDAASISIFDHGLLYGDGVYDTAFAQYGYVFKLRDHIDRLARSANAIHLKLSESPERIEEIVLDVLVESGLSDAYIKILATRGVGPAPLLDPRGCTPTLIVFARPYLSMADANVREKGVRAKIVTIRRVPLQVWDPRVKNLNYLAFVLAKWEATSAGFDEALMLDENDLVCEAPGYNVFAVINGVVVTPLRSILQGITRETILELCTELGIETREDTVAPYDLFNASEVFLTSTAGGIVPIGSVDSVAIGGGPGPVYGRLAKAYDDLLRSGRHGTHIPLMHRSELSERPQKLAVR